jgi:DNA-binding protein HU-beta
MAKASKLYGRDVIRIVARTTRFPQTTVNQVLTAVLKEIRRSVAQGGKVQLLGFGTLYPSQRPASKARHFKTHETIEVPAMRLPRFKPGRIFKKSVRKSLGRRKKS